MTGRGGRLDSVSSKGDRGRREAVGDGTTSRSVEAFQFGKIGSA